LTLATVAFAADAFDVGMFATHGIALPASIRRRQAEFFHGRLAARAALIRHRFPPMDVAIGPRGSRSAGSCQQRFQRPSDSHRSGTKAAASTASPRTGMRSRGSRASWISGEWKFDAQSKLKLPLLNLLSSAQGTGSCCQDATATSSRLYVTPGRPSVKLLFKRRL
jgi:hypothetical protein